MIINKIFGSLKQFLIRLVFVVIACLFAYIIYIKIVQPFLSRKCFFSQTCLRLKYYKFENSVLAHIQPSGYWLWFNGLDAYVYGYTTGRTCQDIKYEPAYKVQKTSGLPTGYDCIDKLDDITKFYKSKGVKSQYLYLDTEGKNFGVEKILNLLDSKNIITLDNKMEIKKIILN